MAGLEIHLLGQFRVIVGGHLVEDARWSNKQAKTLLKHLALAPRREVHREQVIEALWPDADYETGVARLAAVVDAASRILEPKLARSAASSYIHTEKNLIRLAPDPLVRIDADLFDRKATLALSFPETASLESAAALYSGDLLPDDLHADWTATRRDHLKLLHQRVVAHLKAAGEPHAIGILHQAAGTRLAEDDDHDHVDPPPRRRRRIWPWLLILLVAAMAVGAWLWFRSASFHVTSLVIVPLTDDDRLTPLSDGLADDLVERLSHVTGMRVLAGTSVLALRRKRRDPRSIGRELEVEHVLTSRLAPAGAGFTAAFELLRVRDGRRLWEIHLATPDGNLLMLGAQVEQALKVQLPPRPMTSSPEAYRAWLEGLHWRDQGEDDDPKALDAFQRATTLDPNFALAWAALAAQHVEAGTFDQARTAAAKALELDAALADAHVALGRVRMLADWDWPAAEAEFRRAVELNPGSPEPHHGYGLFLAAMGKFDEATHELDRALALDPLSPVLHLHAGYVLFYQRQFDAALARYGRALELSPGYAAARLDRMDAYAALGDLDRAIAEGVLYIEDSGDPDLSIEVSEMLEDHGPRRALRVWMTTGEEARESPILAAHLRALLKDRLGTLQWLEAAFEDRSSDLVTLAVDPTYAFLHADPQFEDLLTRLHLRHP